MTPDQERKRELRFRAALFSVFLIMGAATVVFGLLGSFGAEVYRRFLARHVPSKPASRAPADLAPPVYAVRRDGDTTTLLRYHLLEGRREELGPLRTPRPLERLTCIQPPRDCYGLSGPEAPGRWLFRVDAVERVATEVPGSPSGLLRRVVDMGVLYGPGELLLATPREVAVFDPASDRFGEPRAIEGSDALLAVVVMDEGEPSQMLRGVGEVGRVERLDLRTERRSTTSLQPPIPLGTSREVRVARYVPGLGQWFLVLADPEGGGDGERWFLVDGKTGAVSAARERPG